MSTMTQPRRTVKPKAIPVVSLALAIDHQCYAVTPIRGIQDPDVLRAFRLEKKSDAAAVYDVAATVHGLECTCPDYEARHRGLDASGCKHVKALVALGLLDATTAPPVVEQPAPAPCCPADEPAPCAACVETPEPAPGFADELAEAVWPDWTDEPLGIRLAPDPDDLADAKPDQPGHSQPFGLRPLDADAPDDAEPVAPYTATDEAWWAGYSACLSDLDVSIDRMYARRGEMMAEGGYHSGIDDFDQIPAGCLAGHDLD